MDVTRADEIEAVIGQVVAEFGRLDILVNNAGVNTLPIASRSISFRARSGTAS